jgi:hypothetical protein
MRTDQGIATYTGLVSFSIALGSKNLDGALDDALHLGQGVMNHALNLRKRLGSLHPVIPDALEAFGKHMLHHAPDKRVDFYRFPLDSLALVRTIMIRDLVPIVAIDAPERARRTHHIFGQIRR